MVDGESPGHAHQKIVLNNSRFCSWEEAFSPHHRNEAKISPKKIAFFYDLTPSQSPHHLSPLPLQHPEGCFTKAYVVRYSVRTVSPLSVPVAPLRAHPLRAKSHTYSQPPEPPPTSVIHVCTRQKYSIKYNKLGGRWSGKPVRYKQAQKEVGAPATM